MDSTQTEWERKFDAIARLYSEANDRAEQDPLSAALRARQVIEHIADYLHVRELGPGERNDTLDTRLKRLHAKTVIPRREAVHFGTVQIHTNALIHPDSVPRDLSGKDLAPCLASLQIVVEWFFRDYLKRSVPDVAKPAAQSAGTPAPPDATPMNATSSTAMGAGTRFGTGIGEYTPVWRSKATASTLRFDPPEGEAGQQILVKLEEPARSYFIGREAKRKDGTANDFTLPWKSVSQDQCVIRVHDGETQITNTSGKKNIYVGGELLPDGHTRVLRHTDSVQLGRSVGTFLDGRYYAAVPASAIDPRSGLLSRAGLVVEMAGFMAVGKPRVLFVIRCTDSNEVDAERVAIGLARAAHHDNAAMPVARMGTSVAILLSTEADVRPIWEAIRGAAGAAPVCGFLSLAGAADQANPRLEACLGALNRIAIGGRESAAPENLSRYALVQTPLASFAGQTQPLFDIGGGAILFALAEIERLEQLVPQAVPVLELELLEMLGARMGPRDIIASAGRGLFAFGTPGDVERFAHEACVEWHARGPVTTNALEIDRSLSAHLLTRADVHGLESRAHELVRDGIGALGLGGFPAPLALAARAMDESGTAADRSRALLRLAESAWKVLALVLVAVARAAHARDAATPSTSAGPWPTPWRRIAQQAAARIEGQQTGRMSELAGIVASAERPGSFQSAMETLATISAQLGAATDPSVFERAIPRLEQALREVFSALAPLRGWTLVGVESSEVIDLDGTTQRIEYIDYTGPNPRGSRQRVSAVGFRGLGRFIYLVRWNEGLAIALEPFVRRARNEATGDTELFIAKAPILAPGMHPFSSISSGSEIQLQVTPKQLG